MFFLNSITEATGAEPAPSTTASEMHPAMPSTSSISDISESSYGGGGNNGGRLNGHLASSSVPTPQAGPLKGTAAGGKWSEYTDIKAAPSIIQKRRRRRVLSLSEKLNVALTATAWVRLFAAIIQGVLLFSAWHLASASAPSSWAHSWQQRAFNKAWIHLKRSGYRGNLGPAFKAWKTVTTTKLILTLKQPQWAAFAATAQQHPMAILFAVNIAFILPTFLFLFFSKSSSLGGRSGSGAQDSSSSSFVLWKIVSLVAPALQSQLSYALAVQRLLSSIIDCAVVAVVTMGVCQLAEQFVFREY